MFAEVARDKMTPAEAARSMHREVEKIFAQWRRRGKI
jgi:hypothetical protein